MGSHDVYTVGDGATAQTAYDKLVTEAQYEYGNDVYNGTISTSSGFVMATREPLPYSAAEFLAHQRIENLTKWETWECIPLANDNDFSSKTVKVKVSPNGPTYLDDERQKEIKQLVTLGPGQFLGRVSIEITGAWTPVKLPVGKFRVSGISTEFDTKADALKAAKNLVSGDRQWQPKRLVVTQQMGGYEAVRKNPRAVAEVEILTRKSSANLSTNRWFFYGMASS